MKRPLIWALIFYICGIIAGYYILNIYFLILFILTMLSVNVIIYKKYRSVQMFVFWVFAVFGIININLNIYPKNKTVNMWALNEENVTVSATVEDMDYTASSRQKILLKADSIEKDGQIIKGSIYIQAILKKGEQVQYNQKIVIVGKLKKPDFLRNSGGFNEIMYLKTRGVEYTMFSDTVKQGEIIKSPKTLFYRLHCRTKEVYEKMLPPKEAGIMQAMLLGDKSNLDSCVNELYKTAGISHIIAISGLHISIISSAVMLLVSKLKLNKRFSSAAVMILLILYCIFTGNSVSTVRAVSMIAIGLLGNIIYREKENFVSISAAAFLILIYQPLYIFDVGFQLSFSAAAGMLLLVPVLERIPLPSKIKGSVSSVFAAALSTYPIMTYHFNKISIIGLLVNLAVIPLAGLVIIFGLLAAFIGLFWTLGGKFLCGIVYYILVFYEKICTASSYIPFAQISLARPHLAVLILYYILVIILVYYFNIPKAKRKKEYLKFVLSLIISVRTAIIFFPQGASIVYLDVGQGDSTIIHTSKYNILIDGGDVNKGTEVLIPYLRAKGIKKLDLVFVTHPDSDHIAGIIELLDYVKAEKIIVADLENIKDNELYKAMEYKSEIQAIKIEAMKKGDFIQVEKHIRLECLYPYEDTKTENINNTSLVLQLSCFEKNFLFTGDIEKEAEKAILKEYDKLDTFMLKAAHHGSSSSSTEEFLKLVNAQTAIISSAKNNKYNHPSKEVIKRFEQAGIKYYNTAYEGAISVKVYKNKVKITTMREKNRI